MAIAAVQIGMGFVKFQSGDRVYEIVAIPGIVAVITVCIHLRHSLPARVAGGAFQLTVVSSQPPVGGVVLEGWLLFVTVTFVATVALMAIIADGMNLLFGLLRSNRRGTIVAIAAGLFLMTVGALQTEQIHMLIVIKSYFLPLGVRRVIDTLGRLDDTVLGNVRNRLSGM